MQLASYLLRFALLYFLGELWQDSERVADDAQVGNREDGRVLIFVDGDDVFGAFHAREMLDRATDADGDVERWLDGLAGLPDLVAVGEPAGIDDGACRACRAAQGGRQFLNEVIVLGFAQATPAAYDYAGVFEGGPLALDFDALEHLHDLRTGLQRNVERFNFRGSAIVVFQPESFGARQHYTGALLWQGSCDDDFAAPGDGHVEGVALEPQVGGAAGRVDAV